MKKIIFLIVPLLIVVIIGIIYFNYSERAQDKQEQQSGLTESGAVVIKPQDLYGYKDFRVELLQSALSIKKKVAVFFFKTWDNTSAVLDSNLQKAAAEISSGVLIMKIPYEQKDQFNFQYEVKEPGTVLFFSTEGYVQSSVRGIYTYRQVLAGF